jgi:WD40 repeat protein
MSTSPHILDQPSWIQHLTFSDDSRFLVVAGVYDYFDTCDDLDESQEEPNTSSETLTYRKSNREFGRVRVWNVPDQKLISEFEGGYNDIKFMPQCHEIVTASRNGVDVWDPHIGEKIRPLITPDSGAIIDYEIIAASSDGECVAVAVGQWITKDREFLPKRIMVHTPHSVTVLESPKDDEWSSLRFLPDGHVIASTQHCVDYFEFLGVWDVGSGASHGWDVEEFGRALSDEVQGCMLSTSGRYLLIQGRDVKIFQRHIDGDHWQWDSLGLCPGQPKGIWQSHFAIEEALVVLGAESEDEKGDPCDFTVRIYDVRRKSEMHRLLISGKCFCIAISPDGSTLGAMSGQVSSYLDDMASEYEITLWNLSTGRKLASATTSSKKANDLYHSPERMRFSPDGNWIAVNHKCHAELWEVSALLNPSL